MILTLTDNLSMRKKPAGLTRAELVTTVVILALFAGLLLPWILQRRGVSQRQFCESRQMIVAKGIFLSSVESPRFPGYRELQASGIPEAAVETSWVFPVLPYIHPAGSEIGDELKTRSVGELAEDKDPVRFRDGPYRGLYLDFGEQGNRAGSRIPDYLPELVCPDSGKSPSESQPQPISFVANCGMPDVRDGDGPLDHLPNGVFFDQIAGSQTMTMDFLFEHDGLENTLLISENLNAGQTFEPTEPQVGLIWINSYVDGVATRDPARLLGINEFSSLDDSYRTARPSSYHPGGVNVAFADGSTLFLSERIDYLAYVQYLTSDGFGVRIAGTDEPALDPYRLTR